MNLRRFAQWGAALLVLGMTCAAGAQEDPAAEAWRRLQLKTEQLVALFLEAAAVHNGFVYTIDVVRFDECAQATKLASELEMPPSRLKPLRQTAKTSRYADRYLFTIEPELREQIRSMSTGERTGVVKLANGKCLIAEVVEYKQQAMAEPKELGPLLPLAVDRGWLPHPDLLEQDPKARNRTFANKIRSAADILAAPAGFEINTRRSDGYTILMHALLLNRTDVARAAISHGADPNLCGPRYCPIELALGLRDPREAHEFVELLLQAGADPNQFDHAQRARVPPLAIAVGKDLSFVEQLIEAGAQANGIPETSPPLFVAAAHGKQDVVDYLVSRGADLFAHDASRPTAPNTVYAAARESKDPTFLEWLEKRIVESAVKSGKYKCELWLEQEGRRVPAIAGEFRLKRAPFRIVVRVADSGPGGVMIASAETPAFQQDVRENTRESAIFRPVSTAAEEGEGKSDWLEVLSANASTRDGTTQYWYWTSDTERRFTGRRDAGGGAVEYFKDIRAVGIDQASGRGQFQPIPISEYTGGDIYVVAAVPVELSIFDQRFIDPMLLKLTFIDSARRASR